MGTFVHVGAKIESITMMELGDDSDNQSEASAEDGEGPPMAVVSSETFDILQCKCSVAEDKDKILEIIQAAFGDTAIFNRKVRKLFKHAQHLEYSDSEGTSSDEL